LPLFLRRSLGLVQQRRAESGRDHRPHRAAPPSQGEIVKDRKTGEPTGALKEGAMGLMERVLPKPSHDRKIDALLKGMKLANSFGITSVQNCSGGQDEIDLYAELQKDGRLTVRTST